MATATIKPPFQQVWVICVHHGDQVLNSGLEVGGDGGEDGRGVDCDEVGEGK